MKKILFVCDIDNFSKGAMEFIKWLRIDEPLHVKGLLVTPTDFQEFVTDSYSPVADPYIKLKVKEKRLDTKSGYKFINECKSRNISFQIHDDVESWDIAMLAKETRFADILVISEEFYCTNFLSQQPDRYMKELLRMSECPVIVVPEAFKSPERIVVAYDGKKESIHALKQFCYLLPQLTELPTEFVYIKDEEKNDIPDLDLLREYTKTHFNSLGIAKLHFDAGKYFATWAETKKNILLVTGSFSRSAISNLLRNSFAEQLIHDRKFPVFISHNT